MDFFFHRAQEALVGPAFVASDRVAHLAVVEHRFDFIEVFVKQVLRLLLKRDEQGLVDVGLDPAVIKILACQHQVIDPFAFAARLDAGVVLDAVLQGQQHVHGAQAVAFGRDNRVRQRIDHETGRHARQRLVLAGSVAFALAQAPHLGLVQVFHVFAGMDAQALHQFGLFFVTVLQAAQDGEHGRRMQRVRVQVHGAKGGRRQDQLAVDARFLAVIEGVRYLHDDHAVEQGLVLAFLHEFAEFGQVGVGDNGFIEVDQRKTRDLDVFLLRQRQQQIQELTLDLEDFDHFQHAAAGRIHGAGPRPGARIAFVAILGHLGQVDRADQVGQVGRGRVVRRIGADAAAARLGQHDALDRHLQKVALVLLVQACAAMGTQLAVQLDAIAGAKVAAHALRHRMQRRFMHRAAGDAIQRAVVAAAVRFQAPLEQDHQGRLAARRRAQQQQHAPAHFRAGGRRLEIRGDPADGDIDAEQFVVEQAAVKLAAGVFMAACAQHVPHILMGAAA